MYVQKNRDGEQAAVAAAAAANTERLALRLLATLAVQKVVREQVRCNS
jgi:hypothetical protein